MLRQVATNPIVERPIRRTTIGGSAAYMASIVGLKDRERSARIASMYATVIRLSNENVYVN